MFFSLIKYIIYLAIFTIVLCFLQTWQLERSENQKKFLAGTIPVNLPDGLYSGNIGYKVSWLGKKFDSSASTGINVFSQVGAQGNTTMDKYPFKTYVAKGIRDKSLDVIKIDYNLGVNPFWLRVILDEVIEVSPNQYLGKLQVVLIPGFPFTLGFFELKK